MLPNSWLLYPAIDLSIASVNVHKTCHQNPHTGNSEHFVFVSTCSAIAKRTPFRFDPPVGALCRRERLGGMEVETWVLHPDTSAEDLHWLRAATDEAFRCQPSPTCYCVGAVIRLPDGRTFTGYTHESSPTHHAEQEAIRKALDRKSVV